jgi:hypothetical protein
MRGFLRVRGVPIDEFRLNEPQRPIRPADATAGDPAVLRGTV